MLRKGERITTAVAVKVMCKGAAHELQAVMRDLSEQGMFLAIDTELPGAGVVLSFVIDSDGPDPVITGHGVVRWVDAAGHAKGEPGVGIEFTSLNEPQRLQLGRLFEEAKAGNGRA